MTLLAPQPHTEAQTVCSRLTSRRISSSSTSAYWFNSITTENLPPQPQLTSERAQLRSVQEPPKIEAITEACPLQLRTSPPPQQLLLPTKRLQLPVYFTDFLGEALTRSPSPLCRRCKCLMMKNMTKKPLRGSLTAFSPRAGDRGSTYLGVQSQEGAVPEALIHRPDRHFLPVVLFDPLFKWPTREKQGLIHGVDHTSGKSILKMVGEALTIRRPQPVRDHLGLEQADEVPASFSSVSGLFSGLGRWPAAAAVFHRFPLHPSVECLPLWTVKFHEPLTFRRL